VIKLFGIPKALGNSPIVLVKKKEDASKKEKWQFVVDFHLLNAVMVGSSYHYTSFRIF
jgi:hypothetical protein